ncbi:hypothetical protein D9M72_460760 [compost metagenome]
MLPNDFADAVEFGDGVGLGKPVVELAIELNAAEFTALIAICGEVGQQARDATISGLQDFEPGVYGDATRCLIQAAIALAATEACRNSEEKR